MVFLLIFLWELQDSIGGIADLRMSYIFPFSGDGFCGLGLAYLLLSQLQ
jgi:hypothetical protein